MAKNYVQDGDVVDLTAPYAVVSGQGALIGSLFGVALLTIANGVLGPFALEGVFDLTKVAGVAWTEGLKIYWDNTAKNCTTVPTSNTLIGVATVAATSAAVVGRVRLNATYL